jgi:hypothetical protein
VIYEIALEHWPQSIGGDFSYRKRAR